MATKGAFRGNSKGKLDSLERARNVKISKAEESQFSNAVKDMKSLLPGYDEATEFAYQQGRTMGRQGLPGAMPKPGRSVPKLKIEDLPMQFASNEVVLAGKTRSSLKSRQKAMLPDDYNLMSKFDAAVFNPDAKLTQAVASKLKSSIKSKATMDVQANSVTDNVRADYLKMKSNVMGEIENELGFGFRSPDVNIVSKNVRGSEETQKAMENAAKKTEVSVKALKKRLNSKKEEWNNDQFLLDSYRVKEPRIPGSPFSSKSRGSTQPPNEKLKEISDSFRKSLKVNIDMKRAIKTPRSSSTASKTAKDKGIDLSSSVESMGQSNTSASGTAKGHSREYDSESGRSSSLFTRSNALYHPASGGSGKLVRDSNDTKKRKSVTIRGTKQNRVEDSSSKSSLDLSGIMPLNSLLESHPENMRRSIMKKSDNGHSEQKTSTTRPLFMDFEDLKDATSRLAELPKSSSNSTNNNGAITKVDSVTQKDYGGGETKILSENFYQPPDKGQMQKRETGVNVPVDDFLKQRLGESVKTVDDAATIATRLGSLMTRVAMSKSSHSSNGSLDTVSLARELREIASSMEKDYGGVLGVSSQTSGNVETQTEREQKLMPQPKFTKEMSYTDQLLLQKLRSVQHEWGKNGYPSSAGVVSDKSSPLMDDNK